MGWDWVHLVRRTLIGLLYQPRMIDECRAIGGMRIGRGNRSTRRKPASVPLFPPRIPHDLTWARTRTAAVGSRRLTVWALSRPTCRRKRSWCNFMYYHLTFRISSPTHSNATFGYLDVNLIIIQNWSLNKWCLRIWTLFIWRRIRPRMWAVP
jgi:hypothetical protein